jgi:hypothetical protein
MAPPREDFPGLIKSSNCLTPTYIAKAAATPISGAPLTSMSTIARMPSSKDFISLITNSRGNRVWSIYRTQSVAGSYQIEV